MTELSWKWEFNQAIFWHDDDMNMNNVIFHMLPSVKLLLWIFQIIEPKPSID